MCVSILILAFGCNSPKQELSQAEIDAKIEAARKTDSLLNSSKKLEETKNLSQAFSGIHGHSGLMGTGNLAFDAHQDPEKTRMMIRNYARMAERYKESAPKIESARRKMIERYKEAAAEEAARVY